MSQPGNNGDSGNFFSRWSQRKQAVKQGAPLAEPLPTANAQKQADRPKQIILTVTAQGQYNINKSPVGGSSVGALTALLTPMAAKDITLVISADAMASHQSVVNAMEAARRSGLSQITFATQSSESSGS